MKEYVAPEIEIVKFSTPDVVASISVELPEEEFPV